MRDSIEKGFMVKQLTACLSNKGFELLFWCGYHSGNVFEHRLKGYSAYSFISKEFTNRTQFIWRNE